MSALPDNIAFVACVNNDVVLAACLLQSECIKTFGLIQKRGYNSASRAYNEELLSRDCDVFVFVHQDVYLPRGWDTRLKAAISKIEEIDPEWAVIGLSGKDRYGSAIGHVWSSGMQKMVGRSGFGPTAVVSIDELTIVLRKASGVAFDDKFDGFHMYGTDIVLAAHKAGKNSYVIDAPVIHNSQPVSSYLGDFFRSYIYLRNKWWDVLPVESSCTTLSKSTLGHLKMASIYGIKRFFALKVPKSHRAARVIAQELKLE